MAVELGFLDHLWFTFDYNVRHNSVCVQQVSHNVAGADCTGRQSN